MPVISSEPVEQNNRPLQQGNTTSDTLNNRDETFSNSHFPVKRSLSSGIESSDVVSGSSFEKKPKLDLTKEPKEINTSSSIRHPEVGAPIVEPVKKVTGNGSGVENSSANNVFEEISEPVLFIIGRGMGKDCNVGNPRTENGRQKTTNGFGAAKKEPKGVQKDSEENESGSDV